MAWLMVDQALPSHRKILIGAQLVSMDEHKYMGHVVHLWLWALDHADDRTGALPVLPDDMIGIQAGLPKRQARGFVESMVDVGLLRRDGHALLIKDWWIYGGKLNEKRRKDRERMQNSRATVPRLSPNGSRTVAR